MMNYIDKKYIQLISPHLKRFKQKSDNLWNYRCHVCGDSQKNSLKARAYIFERDGNVFTKCHNCGYSTNLYNLIKSLDTSLYREYVLEKFSNKKVDWTDIQQKNPSPINQPQTINCLLESIAVLPENHWVMQYILYRRIPMTFWTGLYFAPDFKQFVDEFHPTYGKKLIENEPRLIIPFYDEDSNFIGFQGRALQNNNIRYITIKISEESFKLYGLERVNKNKKIYVTEGPIDSMFLDNSVSTCDHDLTRAAKYLPKENLVLAWDNEYTNKDISRSIRKAIDFGYNVVIFPKEIKEKDINDCVMNGLDIKQIIENNTYNGLKAILELQNR